MKLLFFVMIIELVICVVLKILMFFVFCNFRFFKVDVFKLKLFDS